MNEELRIKITAQIAEAQKNLKEIQKQLGDIGADGEKSSKKFGDAFKKMGEATKQALAVTAKAVATATATATAGVVALTKSAIENYAEYEQLVGGVDTLFKESSQKVQKYAQDAYKTAGMSANEYMASVTSFSASLLQSVAGDTDKASEIANMAMIDMSDNANKMGTSMEAIQNAYQGFAKQNYTMLDNLKLGYGGTKTEMERLLADAEKISGVKYDISNLSDVYNAIHIIQNELGITGTTAKEASSTIQGATTMMKASWSNLITGMADENANFDALLANFIESVGVFGENLIPRIEIALDGVVKLISGLAPKIVEVLPQLVNTVLPSAIEAITGIVNALANVLPQILTAVVNALTTIVPILMETMNTTLPMLLETILMLIPQITEGLLGCLPLLIETTMTIISALLVGLGEMLPQIVAQVVAIIPQIVETFVDNIPTLLMSAIAFLMAIVDAIPQIIPQLIEALPTIIDSVLDCLINSLPLIINSAITLFMAIVDAIPQIIPALMDALPQIINSIIDAYIDYLPIMLDGAITLFMAIVEAIPAILPDLLYAIGELVGKVLGALVGRFKDIGTAIGDAIGGSIKGAIQLVLKSAIGIINGFIGAINLCIGVINAIPGIEISKLKKLDVPKLAKGGVVDGATMAVIGEQGKEMVMPLENNLEYLDKLAGMITERMGGGNKPIVLEVDGKVFAKTAIRTINQDTSQRGKLALNLV